MQSFSLYTEAWAIYILLGLLLLFVLDLKLRQSGFKRRVAVLSFIATFAFTPQMVSETDTYAPLVLNSLFNAEVEGAIAIYQGLVTLVAIWGLTFACILAIRHFVKAKQHSSSNQ